MVLLRDLRVLLLRRSCRGVLAARALRVEGVSATGAPALRSQRQRWSRERVHACLIKLVLPALSARGGGVMVREGGAVGACRPREARRP